MFNAVEILRVAKMQEYFKSQTVKGLQTINPNARIYNIIIEIQLNDNPVIAVVPK